MTSNRLLAAVAAFALSACTGLSPGEPSEPGPIGGKADEPECSGARLDEDGVCRLPNGRFAAASCCEATAKLSADQLKAAIEAVAPQAVYYSEGDSIPTVVIAEVPEGAVTREVMLGAFAEHFTEYGDEIAFEIEGGERPHEWLAGAADAGEDPDEYTLESAEAFGTIQVLVEDNLVDLTFVRVGPADEEGNLAVDQGAYLEFILGRSGDGKLAGFFIISVET